MKYGSVCSGIEAATCAWHDLTWEPQWFAEIDKFPSAVLAHHYPEVPNLGDMTEIRNDERFTGRPIRLLVGGTPCQSFSVAGLRKGMADPRGNLALEFLALADLARPKWVVWENVPGVLSSNEGRDFGAFLGALGELGYGWAYRVIDAQHCRTHQFPFAVPQRRRRVFVVGCLGNQASAAAVLFEQESLSGNPPPRREKGQRIATYPASSIGSYGESDGAGTLGNHDRKTLDSATGLNPTAGQGGTAVALPIHDKATRCKGGGDDRNNDGAGNGLGVGKDGDPSPTLTSGDKHAVFSIMPMNSGKDYKARETEVAQPVMTKPVGGNQGGDYAVAQNQRGELRESEVSMSLNSGGGKPGEGYAAVRTEMAVRRLTPVECERLQGFPDNFTRIPYRGKDPEDCPDGPRYKALGNSMAVNVMQWIGERIDQVDKIDGEKQCRMSQTLK